MNLASYIGIPYAPPADDCWTLVRRFAREELGIAFPEYFYEIGEDCEGAAEMITAATHIGRNWTRVAAASIGDVITFRIKGRVSHCGIYVGNGDFLHSLEGRASCLERLDHWQQRIDGIYTYAR